MSDATTVGTAAVARTDGAAPRSAAVTVPVRYFAAAAEAAGTASETLTAATAGDLRAAMVEAHGADLERVLTRCSLLADGARIDADEAPLRQGVTVDVLPPFAGG